MEADLVIDWRKWAKEGNHRQFACATRRGGREAATHLLLWLLLQPEEKRRWESALASWSTRREGRNAHLRDRNVRIYPLDLKTAERRPSRFRGIAGDHLPREETYLSIPPSTNNIHRTLPRRSDASSSSSLQRTNRQQGSAPRAQTA